MKRKCNSVSAFYGTGKRIHGCSACLSGLGSQDKHVALASVIRNTRLVFGSFSARYILEIKHTLQQILFSVLHLWTEHRPKGAGDTNPCACSYPRDFLLFFFYTAMKIAVSPVVNVGEQSNRHVGLVTSSNYSHI